MYFLNLRSKLVKMQILLKIDHVVHRLLQLFELGQEVCKRYFFLFFSVCLPNFKCILHFFLITKIFVARKSVCYKNYLLLWLKKGTIYQKCKFCYIFFSGGADDIDVHSIRIMQENLTYGVLNFKWDEPKDYNGLIVNYYVEIKSSDVSILNFNIDCRWIYLQKYELLNQ